jgi:lactoylglutathione lyase
MRILVLAVMLTAVWAASAEAPSGKEAMANEQKMKLGAFSVSLAVKDIAASRAFYEKLGFAPVMGDEKQNWLILRHGDTTIGLFQEMFERNLLTFNPGWNAQAQPVGEFTDVREIQQSLKAKGLKLATEADETTTGAASLVVIDPDGNPILLDQHVESPESWKQRKK